MCAEVKAPSTDEELEDGLLIGLVKSADLTLEALQAKLAQPGSKEHVTRKDRHGRVPMHYACENAAACREPRTLALLGAAEPACLLVQDAQGAGMKGKCSIVGENPCICEQCRVV